MTTTALLIALVAVAVAVVIALRANRRARLAAVSARRAARAAETAQQHCDGLIELLADLSPSARRVWLVTRGQRSPALVAAQRRQFQRRDLIDEGTT